MYTQYVTVKLSTTSPEPSWIAFEIKCSTPGELAQIVKDTVFFCHYFDEKGIEFETLEDALKYLGVTEEEMTAFKRSHGLFTLFALPPGSNLLASLARLTIFVIAFFTASGVFPTVSLTTWELITLVPFAIVCYTMYKTKSKLRFALWSLGASLIVAHLLLTLISGAAGW